MELEIFWTQLAENKLIDIFNYYRSKAGIKIAKKITTEIIDKTLKLEKIRKLDKLKNF